MDRKRADRRGPAKVSASIENHRRGTTQHPLRHNSPVPGVPWKSRDFVDRRRGSFDRTVNTFRVWLSNVLAANMGPGPRTGSTDVSQVIMPWNSETMVSNELTMPFGEHECVLCKDSVALPWTWRHRWLPLSERVQHGRWQPTLFYTGSVCRRDSANYENEQFSLMVYCFRRCLGETNIIFIAVEYFVTARICYYKNRRIYGGKYCSTRSLRTPDCPK
jgi:hypothetical protein